MNQPADTFAQRTRRLTSEVQRLRDWAGGDPARLSGVADALVELTAHRLAGHAWAEAAPSAQEAVVLSAKVLAAHGPVGPYTPRADAVRSITALVHLAVIQSAAGLTEGAGQTLAAALGLRGQLSRMELDADLSASTRGWALLTWARVAMAEGELTTANARADAAACVTGDLAGWLPVDIDRMVADARWAAGWPQPSVEYALRALERYDAEALELLQQPAAVPAAMLDRLSEPLFGVYSDAADRVQLIGAPGLALTLRRRLVDLLGGLAVRRADAQPLLVTALSDLADDLRSAGRAPEADDVAELASSIAGESDQEHPMPRPRAALGAQASWTSLPAVEAFGVEPGAAGEASGRLAAQRGPADEAEQRLRTEVDAELARRAQQATIAARRAEEQSARRLAEQQRRAAEQAEATRLAEADARAAADAEREEKQRRRAERIAEHERQAQREAAEREAALRARVSDETDEERAEREELERIAAEEQAERDELERIAVEVAALEAAEAAELAALERELAESEALEQAQRVVDHAADEVDGIGERAEFIADDAVEQAELIAVEAGLAQDEAVAQAEIEAEQIADDAGSADDEAMAEAEAVAQARLADAERQRLLAEEAELEQAAVAQAELDRVAAEEEIAARDAEAAAEQAERERIEAEQAEEARLATERAAAEAAAAQAERERLEDERLEAERVAAAQAEQDRLAAERAEADRARAAAERLEHERRQAELQEAERQEAERVEAERLEAERAEAERVEAERLEDERQAAERQEAERVEAERVELERAEAERLEAERLEAERLEAERLEAERLEAERAAAAAAEAAEAEPAEQPAAGDPLEQARANLEVSTGRREVREATEALVELLQGRYEADPDTYLPDYLDALDQLATARWQAGDWWGSRGPSKEAKALRKEHGL